MLDHCRIPIVQYLERKVNNLILNFNPELFCFLYFASCLSLFVFVNIDTIFEELRKFKLETIYGS